MTELAWTATRTETIDRFQGQVPRPEDEATIIDVFETHPQLVLRAIDETEAALKAGKITYAWSILASRLLRGTQALREATADTSAERTKRIRNAKTWINNAGIHYDREQDVQADLFGDDYGPGRLPDADNKTREKLLECWRTERPRGEQAERDAHAWNLKCAADRQTILEQRHKALAEIRAQLDAQQTPQPEPEPEPVASADDDIPF